MERTSTPLIDTMYSVETPEGVALSLRPAGIFPRALAYIIDQLIRMAIWIVLAIISAFWGSAGWAVFLIGIFFLEWFYPVFFEISKMSGTPGKRVMDLRVVMDTGLPITTRASLLRNLLRTVDFLPALYAFGAITILFRRDFKRLGDLAAGTLVVYSDIKRYGSIESKAVPTPPVRALSLRQQQAILNWAERLNRLTPERSEEIALLAANVCPPAQQGQQQNSTQALLGVALWLSGNRGTHKAP